MPALVPLPALVCRRRWGPRWRGIPASAGAGGGTTANRLTSPSCRRKSLQKSNVWVTLAI
jgi:hypothetical protein